MEVESFLLVIPTMFHWKPQPEAKVVEQIYKVHFPLAYIYYYYYLDIIKLNSKGLQYIHRSSVKSQTSNHR
jgi:hypothetical protein